MSLYTKILGFRTATDRQRVPTEILVALYAEFKRNKVSSADHAADVLGLKGDERQELADVFALDISPEELSEILMIAAWPGRTTETKGAMSNDLYRSEAALKERLGIGE